MGVQVSSGPSDDRSLAGVAASRNVPQPLGLPWMEHARSIRRTKLRRKTTLNKKGLSAPSQKQRRTTLAPHDHDGGEARQVPPSGRGEGTSLRRQRFGNYRRRKPSGWQVGQKNVERCAWTDPHDCFPAATAAEFAGTVVNAVVVLIAAG